MIDIKLILIEEDRVVRDLVSQGMNEFDATDLIKNIAWMHNQRKATITTRDKERSDLNVLKNKISEIYKTQNKKLAEPLKDKAALLKISIADSEKTIAILEPLLLEHSLKAANVLDPTVPVGMSEEDNVLIAEVEFSERKMNGPDHMQIGNAAGFRIADAVKMSGKRFSALQGDMARLERAIGNFFLDIHTEKHGYTEVAVPYIVGREAMIGTGQLPKFEKDMFKVSGLDREAYLIPTAEVALTNLYREKVVKEYDLPIKVTALTPCFRAEAGAYGQESKGLIRQHQFNKVELVQLVTPETAVQAHEELLKEACAVLEMLGLSYRVMLLCSGDTSFAAYKCYDIEVWLPSQGRYREISSVSHFGDFQARRMKTKYKPSNGGKNQFVHTLNGSGLAVGRTLVAIIENYYSNGKIIIPEKLIPYMNGKEFIEVGELK